MGKLADSPKLFSDASLGPGSKTRFVMQYSASGVGSCRIRGLHLCPCRVRARVRVRVKFGVRDR